MPDSSDPISVATRFEMRPRRTRLSPPFDGSASFWDCRTTLRFISPECNARWPFSSSVCPGIALEKAFLFHDLLDCHHVARHEVGKDVAPLLGDHDQVLEP